ncbi:hypothetical protein LBMAG56_18480 [Verrucomicrobiota bacterium]|nr:hypothetical protein LBMAG56_18480 [Verrucomicrobiota bacterium]
MKTKLSPPILALLLAACAVAATPVTLAATGDTNYYGPNIVSNGGFEFFKNGVLGWQSYGWLGEWDALQKKSGTHSVKVTALVPDRDAQHAWSQPVSVLRHTRYRLSG